jgi:hypothetical protein
MKPSPVDLKMRSEPMELCCDDCGADLTSSYDEAGEGVHCGASWFWWSRPSVDLAKASNLPPVDHLGIRCAECHQRLHNIEERGERSLYDGYLEWFGGLRALPKLFQLLRDNEWTPEARDRLGDIFVKLQLLPTSTMDTSWMV